MKATEKILKAAMAAIAISVSLETAAVNYYVSKTGSDANAGTSAATAKLTLANVFSSKNLASGDTIFVAAGTYTDKTITVGSDDEAFVIQGSDPSSGDSTIYDSDQTSYWLRLNNANNDNITINNIKVKDYKGGSSNGGALRIGLGVDGITGTKVNNCIFENCDTQSTQGGGAIYCSSSSSSTISITRCTFYDCGSGSYGGGAVCVDYSGMSSGDVDITIAGCVFRNNTSSGHGSALLISGYSGSSITIYNCLLYDNQCTGSSTNGVIYTNLYSTMSITNCTIYGNTAVSSPHLQTGGLYIFGGGITANTSTVSNCIIYGNSNYDIYEANGTVNVNNTCYQSQYNTTVTSCITSDPLFTNAAAKDFTLLSTSPCINTGTNTGAPLQDYDGTSREGTTDMGAMEYTTPPAMPIVLISFDAVSKGIEVTAKWVTASERNVELYEVEYSTDAINFQTLCRRPGGPDNSEIISHSCTGSVDARQEKIYLRLKEIDYDGRTEYFKILAVSMDTRKRTIVGIYNLRGEEVSPDNSGLLIIKYSDGTYQKTIRRQ